jgi:hypothetical protein
MGASRNAAALTDFFTFLWNPETSPAFLRDGGEKCSCRNTMSSRIRADDIVMTVNPKKRKGGHDSGN